jgi:hypothetical protein
MFLNTSSLTASEILALLLLLDQQATQRRQERSGWKRPDGGHSIVQPDLRQSEHCVLLSERRRTSPALCFLQLWMKAQDYDVTVALWPGDGDWLYAVIDLPVGKS